VNGKISKEGNLLIERVREGKNEFIRSRCKSQTILVNSNSFAWVPCCDSCVFFGEPINDNTYIYLNLCEKKLIFDILIDERE